MDAINLDRMASGVPSINVGNAARKVGLGWKCHAEKGVAAKNRADVDAFHAAAMTAGGTDNGVPGLRDTAKGYPEGYYAALVLDPDGNNMEAVFRGG